MRKIILSMVVSLFLQGGSFTAMSAHALPSLSSASNVDLAQYVGKWYEIVRLPQVFENKCVGVTAEYELRSDGKLSIKNTCRKFSCDGRVIEANGIGRVIDTRSNSKFKVNFSRPFEGDYWILEHDAGYTYAVIGTPDRNSFWILSRTPEMSDSEVQSILARFEAKGFNFSKLIKTQSCES